MRRPSRAGLSLVLAFCAGIPLAAQNLESIGKEKPLSFSGGLSFNQIVYSSRGIAARRDPYRYIVSGNVNLSLYGWSVPLTFSVSEANTAFYQPFNQYAVHPTWKWITAHAGYTSMSFSPYTVNGHIFLGGAVELAPEGMWKFSVLCGRFLKAISHDTTHLTGHLPAYQRMGYGMKATYGNSRDFVDLIAFHAADDATSAGSIPDSLLVTPQENMVLSIAAGKRFLKHFLAKAELATSAITRDTRSEKTKHSHPLAQTGIGFTPRLSSSYYRAFKTSFDYQKDGRTLGISYERIDPGYRTLGAYYFNNDLENIALNGSATLLNGKLGATANAGIQRDNLDKRKMSTMRRMVSAVNLNFTPSQRLNMAASWSSFQTYTNIRSKFETLNQLTPFDNFDTLNFTQISRNASLSGMYTLPGTENKKQNITVQFTWQDAADRQGERAQLIGTRFYNISAGYSLALIPRGLNVSLMFNTAINEGAYIQSRMMGPTATISRAFFQRKLKTSLSSSYTHTNSDGLNINSVLNYRGNAVVAVRKKHHINISAVMATRITRRESSHTSFTEFTGTVGYSYAFGGR